MHPSKNIPGFMARAKAAAEADAKAKAPKRAPRRKAMADCLKDGGGK